MKKILLSVLAFFTLMPSAFGHDTDIELYSEFSDIPEFIIFSLDKRKPYFEDYLYTTMSVFRRYAKLETALTYDDIRDYLENTKKSRKRQQFTKLIRYDSNFDGKVTYEEVVNFFSRSKPFRDYKDDKRVKDVMVFDLNEDNLLDLKEMSTVNGEEQSLKHLENTPLKLLKLDPNDDGILTALEYKRLLVKAYKTVDKNGDDILSNKELEVLKPLKRAIRQKRKAERDFQRQQVIQDSKDIKSEDSK